MVDEQHPRRWRRRDRSNERLQLEADEVREAVRALRSGDLDGAEEAIAALRLELRDEIRGSDSYVPIFLLTLFLVIAVPLSFEHTLFSAILSVIATATVILSLRRSHVSLRTLRILAAVAVVAGIGSILAIYAVESGGTAPVLVATSSFLFAFLVAITLPAMLRRVLTSRQVTINTLAGAISAYLLLGLFFATSFRCMSTVSDQAFFVQKPQPSASDFEYFSFITLTTVGYGDLSPSGDAARAGAVCEAIVGQVFLVTIVARVVSTISFQYERREADRDPPGSPGSTG